MVRAILSFGAFSHNDRMEVICTGDKRMDPRQQFSKKLAKWTAAFWFVYMAWLSVLFMLQPSAAQYVVYMALIATVVMIINVWAYTKNSVYEKSLLAMLDKTKMELTLGKGSASDEPEEAAQQEGDDG